MKIIVSDMQVSQSEIKESNLLFTIESYIKRTNFPKNLVIKKLRLLKDKYERILVNAVSIVKKSDTELNEIKQKIETYRKSNLETIQELTDRLS